MHNSVDEAAGQFIFGMTQILRGERTWFRFDDRNRTIIVMWYVTERHSVEYHVSLEHLIRVIDVKSFAFDIAEEMKRQHMKQTAPAVERLRPS